MRLETIVLSNYLKARQSVQGNAFLDTQTLGAQARYTDAKTKVREAQLKLLQILNISPGAGYPIPTTTPFCGKTFDLGTPQTFNAHMTRSCGMILERLKVAQELSAQLAEPEDTLKLDLTNTTDVQSSIAALEGRRELAIGYVQTVVDLNKSIAEYVSFYPAYATNEQFAKALGGKDKE